MGWMEYFVLENASHYQTNIYRASSSPAWWCYPISECRNNEAERGMTGCVRGATMIIHNFFTWVSLGAVSSSLVRQTGLLLLLLRQDDVSMEVHLVPQLGVVHNDPAAAPGLRVHAHAQVGYVVLNAVAAHRSAACRVFSGVVADLLNRVYQAPEPDIVDPYLSWKVMVGLLREEREVRWQVRDDIICVSNSNGMRQVSLEVRSKSSIADARLPKCHQLYII